jgi:hypothetical protein
MLVEAIGQLEEEVPAGLSGNLLEQLDVCPGAKGPAGAREDHGANVGIAFADRGRVGQFINQL